MASTLHGKCLRYEIGEEADWEQNAIATELIALYESLTSGTIECTS